GAPFSWEERKLLWRMSECRVKSRFIDLNLPYIKDKISPFKWFWWTIGGLIIIKFLNYSCIQVQNMGQK
ncbi:hypothetical protein, partial [Paenibacillus endophyticus]|uniref:hypothetical protein n=1 Tax=Paenibacillus endophyticus TaxID=1294268 RepID=UPI0039F071FF